MALPTTRPLTKRWSLGRRRYGRCGQILNNQCGRLVGRSLTRRCPIGAAVVPVEGHLRRLARGALLRPKYASGMTANDPPVCPGCEQEYLRRLRFRGSDRVYLACLECESLWESEQFRRGNYRQGFLFRTFLTERDLRFPDDTYWIDLPFRIGQIIRSRDYPEAVGVITGLADRNGRAYDVEFLGLDGHVTFSGRMKAGRFYPTAREVWKRRYQERRAKGAGA
jgi:hypothetical protein